MKFVSIIFVIVFIAAMAWLIANVSAGISPEGCNTPQSMLDFVFTKYGEEPFADVNVGETPGKQNDGIITFNSTTTSWSLLVEHQSQPGMWCFITGGTKFAPTMRDFLKPGGRKS